MCSEQNGEDFCERGVEIFSTRLAINSGGTLREGFPSQNIGFDITMSPRVTAGSVSGFNLWKVTVFGSANPNGVGTRVGETQVNLNQFQAGADVILDLDTVLQGISAQWNLNSGTRCAEIPYFCALVEKNDNPSPDFFLSEPPQIACQPITCRGVEVTGTSIRVDNDYPIVERRNQHPVTFDLNIATDPEGGRVIGNNLWAVSFYYSTSDIPGNGVSSPSSSVVLTPFQSGTDIVSPGVPTTLEELSGTLNLSSAVCRNAQYVCAILSRNPSSDPLFSLSPAPGSDESVMESCYLVQCQDACMFDNPCQNEGTCMEDEDNPGDVKCVCQDGYRGLYCGESTPWLLIAALVGGLAVFTLLLVILIISCAKAKNRSSARNEPDVSNLLFLVGRAMAVMSNSRRQRPALKVEHPDPEAVADEPNVGVYMDPENRGQENMGPPNRPPPPLPGRPRRSFHLYASRVAGLFRTTSNREEQH